MNQHLEVVPTLFGDLEVLLGAEHHGLQHLVGRDVGLEVTWVPQLPHQLPEALHQQEHDVTRGPANTTIVLLLQEIVPQGRDIRQGLER